MPDLSPCSSRPTNPPGVPLALSLLLALAKPTTTTRLHVHTGLFLHPRERLLSQKRQDHSCGRNALEENLDDIAGISQCSEGAEAARHNNRVTRLRTDTEEVSEVGNPAIRFERDKTILRITDHRAVNLHNVNFSLVRLAFHAPHFL